MMDLESKVAVVSATICWLEEFDVLEIPKRIKVSYFLAPQFFHAVLKYLMAIDENEMDEGVPLNFNKEIEATKKSSLEKFLDVISIEFNKHSKPEAAYDDNPDNEIQDLTSFDDELVSSNKNIDDKVKSPADSTIFQVEILNHFLTQIDIEVLSAWKSDEPLTDGKNYGHQSTRKKFMDEANKLFWGTAKEGTQDEEANRTLRNDPIIYKKKVFQRNDYLMQKKVSSELYDLGILDVVDLINQLYLYMSVILCVGILGKRAAWGITQMNYLDNKSKLVLRAWCKNEAKLKEFDLQVEDNEDIADIDVKGNIASTASLNLQSSNLNYILGNAGWMNVSDGTESEVNSNGKILKKFEEFIARNELVEHQNQKLLAANEELKIKIQSLYEAIENLTRESKGEKTQGEAKVLNHRILEGKHGVEGESSEEGLIEMRKRYEDIIHDLKAKFVETQNNNYDLKEEVKFLELKNIDLVQDKDLTIARLDAEKSYFENLHYISCLGAEGDGKEKQENGEEERLGIEEKSGSSNTKAILLLTKALIEKQNAYQESVDEIKKEVLRFSSKYEILKTFTKKIRERNLQYSLAVNEMLENDRRVWEWVMGLKYRIKKVEKQLGKMRDKMDEILIVSRVSPEWAREVEGLRRTIHAGLEEIEGYLWSGKHHGTKGKAIAGAGEERGRVGLAENGVETDSASREDTMVRSEESEETRIVK